MEIDAEYPGLFWIKLGGILVVAFSVIYPIGYIVIGGYIRDRRERKGK